MESGILSEIDFLHFYIVVLSTEENQQKQEQHCQIPIEEHLEDFLPPTLAAFKKKFFR